MGVITAAHGVSGEVKVEVATDFPERFAAGSALWLDGQPRRVERARPQRRSLILKLEGVDDRTAAEALRGHELLAPRLADLPEGTYYRDDLIGLKVVDSRGQALGTLADIFATGSNDVYVVRSSRGELLLPATDDVVTAIDLHRGLVTVEVLEGLEWAPPARAPREPRRPHPA